MYLDRIKYINNMSSLHEQLFQAFYFGKVLKMYHFLFNKELIYNGETHIMLVEVIIVVRIIYIIVVTFMIIIT